VQAREEAFTALEAVQRECRVYLADHCESPGPGHTGDSGLWQRTLDHVLGSREWWEAHYRETTSEATGPPPLCSEVMRRTLGAFAAISFTAVDEMHRQQVEWRLFGEVTRPRAPSPEWAALAAIGHEVRSAVRDVRCPDDTEAFNARSVVSFFLANTGASRPEVAGAPAETRLRIRDLVVFALPRRIANRPVAPAPPDGAGVLPELAGAAARAPGQFVGSRWMRAIRNPRLRGA